MRNYKTKLDVGFNSKTRRVKGLNLERLSSSAADFVKHVNFVLYGSPYAICEVIEDRCTSSRLFKKKGDTEILGLEITLYTRGQKPEYSIKEGLAYIQLWAVEEENHTDFIKFKKPGNIQAYEERIMDYDFSKIR